jgi:hypothetical protein
MASASRRRALSGAHHSRWIRFAGALWALTPTKACSFSTSTLIPALLVSFSESARLSSIASSSSFRGMSWFKTRIHLFHSGTSSCRRWIGRCYSSLSFDVVGGRMLASANGLTRAKTRWVDLYDSNLHPVTDRVYVTTTKLEFVACRGFAPRVYRGHRPQQRSRLCSTPLVKVNIRIRKRKGKSFYPIMKSPYARIFPRSGRPCHLKEGVHPSFLVFNRPSQLNKPRQLIYS